MSNQDSRGENKGEFTCGAHSNPEASIRWFFSTSLKYSATFEPILNNVTSEVRLADRLNFFVTSTLLSTETRMGLLKCEAKNSLGAWHKTLPISKLIRLYTEIFIAPNTDFVFWFVFVLDQGPSSHYITTWIEYNSDHDFVAVGDLVKLHCYFITSSPDGYNISLAWFVTDGDDHSYYYGNRIQSSTSKRKKLSI